MLWTSIATGKHAYHHGVCGFTEVEPGSNRVVPVSAATRRCRTVWEMLGDHGLRSNVVGWFATHGERHPAVNLVSNLFPHAPKREMPSPQDWPPPPAGTYWPESLGTELNDFRLHPTELDGDILRLFVPRMTEIDQRKDSRIYQLAEKIAEAISIHAAATWLMEHRPWNLTAVYYRAIDEICHDFMPYHAPKMEGIPEADFELYQDVVNSAYRWHDMFLTRLIQLAGPDACVMLVSDHGFHSDHLRPQWIPNVPAGIVAWHRPQGIFAAAGPGWTVGEEIHGARLLDITPTILRWFDLPRGADMEGRVLHEAFVGPPIKAEIPSWENAGTADNRPQTRPPLSDEEGHALLQQFVALGYIEVLPEHPAAAAEITQRENDWQLAQAWMNGGRPEEALPLFEDVFTAHPERVDFAQRLAHCQIQLGLLDEAEGTIAVAIESFAKPIGIHLIRANLASLRGNAALALTHLEVVRDSDPESLQLWEQLSRTYLTLRRWDDCEAAARRILAQDPEHFLAWVAIARCQLHRGENEAAVASALEAIALNYQSSLAHLNLGLGLFQLQRWEEAAHAFRNATVINRHLIPPYRWLSYALRKLGRTAEADQTLERARSLRGIYDFQSQQQLDRRRDQASARATERRARRDARRAELMKRQAEADAVPVLDLVIVSGLPRSGTSLMMQMLAAGGLTALTDHVRVPDENNLEGYYEWESVKQLNRNPRLIEQADGKAVKVISALLGHLPTKHRYKLIFMRRPVAEVVRSQARMLERGGRSAQAEAAHLERMQTEHVEFILKAAHASPRTDVLEVDFPSLVAEPLEGARRVIEFLGPRHLPSADAAVMAAVAQPKLYRERVGQR